MTRVRLDLVVEERLVVGVVVAVEALVVIIEDLVVVEVLVRIGFVIEPGRTRVFVWRYFSSRRCLWWIRLLQVPDHQFCKLWVTVFSGTGEVCKSDAPLHAHLVVPGVLLSEDFGIVVVAAYFYISFWDLARGLHQEKSLSPYEKSYQAWASQVNTQSAYAC